MLQITNDNPNCNMGYNYGGYGYNTTNTNDDGLLHLLGGQRELTKAIYDSENDVRTNLDSIGSLITDGQSRLTTNVTTVSRDVLNTQHDLSKEIGDNKFYTSISFSDVRQELSLVNNDLSKQIAHLSLENYKAESRTREELLKGFAATQLDACKNTSEITKQASELAASIAKQIAECCCETKQLFAQAENNRLRDQLANLERNCNNNNLELTIRNVINNSNITRT